MKLLIIGKARHGKDTAAEILRDNFGVKFESSSHFALRKVIYPIVKDYIGYETEEECYEDRVNHRSLWFELIKLYAAKDPTRLSRELLEENDIYVGLRNRREFEASKKFFTHVIWVDATDRLGDTEDESSNELNREDANIVVRNNGSYEEFVESIVALYTELEKQY